MIMFISIYKGAFFLKYVLGNDEKTVFPESKGRLLPDFICVKYPEQVKLLRQKTSR